MMKENAQRLGSEVQQPHAPVFGHFVFPFGFRVCFFADGLCGSGFIVKARCSAFSMRWAVSLAPNSSGFFSVMERP